MTTQVYHVTFTAEELTALTSLHYVGTLMARALKKHDATPEQQAQLCYDWALFFNDVTPAVQRIQSKQQQ